MNISVCMATYNGESYVYRQVMSILKQLSSNDQFIIVDDHSNDGTCQIINNIKDKRIKLIINQKNIGFVFTFEKAILLAENDLVFLSDQDDEWYPNKVDVIKNIFAMQAVDLIIHNAQVLDSNNNILLPRWHTRKLGGNLFTRHFVNNHNMGCMMAFRRNISTVLYPFPKYVESHDQWIGLNADIMNKKVYFLDENLIKWFRHGQNASSMKPRSILKILLSRIKMFILMAIVIFRILKNNNKGAL